MARRKRKRAKPYRVGGYSLTQREEWVVADFKDEGTGRRQRVRLGKFDKDSKEARAELDRFIDQRRAIQQQFQSRTVGDLWDMWLAERAEDGFNNDIYKAQWVSLRPVFAHRDPATLTTQDFRAYAKARFALGRAQWTVHTELVRIRALLKWAVDHHHIDRRPKVWVPQPGKPRDRVLTRPEAMALVSAASYGDPHVHLFVVIAFATAARHMAILDLKWDRVDFLSGMIEFDENLPPDPMNKSWRKGRAKVLMNRSVRAALEKAYQGRQTDHVIEHGGRRLVTVKNGFAAAVKRAGLDQSKGRITPHTIRHTVLTWLQEEQVPTDRRAQLAGHKDEATTRLVYTHASPEVLREAVDLLDEVFAALTKQALEGSSEGSILAPKQRLLSRVDKSDSVTGNGADA
jgi:integrase